jgi:hypothetical protein
MDTRSLHCPNCSAPIDVPLGETEHLCEYCGSHLRLLPSGEEMEVVRTREEMKYRERVAVQQQILRNRMEQEEMDRWRQLAGRVAISALPVVGQAAGRALFRAAATRGGGCTGCGCLSVLGAVVVAAALLGGLLHRL